MGEILRILIGIVIGVRSRKFRKRMIDMLQWTVAVNVRIGLMIILWSLKMNTDGKRIRRKKGQLEVAAEAKVEEGNEVEQDLGVKTRRSAIVVKTRRRKKIRTRIEAVAVNVRIGLMIILWS